MHSCIRGDTFKYDLHSLCSVYPAELYLLYKELFYTLCENFESFVILTGSLSVLQTHLIQYVVA